MSFGWRLDRLPHSFRIELIQQRLELWLQAMDGNLGAWLTLHLLTRNRFTLHDGPLSVRRAYTLAEVRALLAEAGLRPVWEIVGIAGHRWAIAAVRG